MFKATRILSKEMYFTDDGFAIGLSYCLAILKQTKKAQSLHWFDTVNAKHDVDVAHIRKSNQIAFLSMEFLCFL